MFLHIYSVKHCADYCLECGFTNGEKLRINLQNELYGEVFTPLLDVKLFSQVYVNPDTGTIEWENGADFAPEFLYALAQKQVHSSETLSTP